MGKLVGADAVQRVVDDVEVCFSWRIRDPVRLEGVRWPRAGHVLHRDCSQIHVACPVCRFEWLEDVYDFETCLVLRARDAPSPAMSETHSPTRTLSGTMISARDSASRPPVVGSVEFGAAPNCAQQGASAPPRTPQAMADPGLPSCHEVVGRAASRAPGADLASGARRDLHDAPGGRRSTRHRNPAGGVGPAPSHEEGRGQRARGCGVMSHRTPMCVEHVETLR